MAAGSDAGTTPLTLTPVWLGSLWLHTDASLCKWVPMMFWVVLQNLPVLGSAPTVLLCEVLSGDVV